MSALLKSVGHEPIKRIMQAEYHSGEIWNYDNVTVEEYQATLKATSIGGHFIKHIRDNKLAECVISVRKAGADIPASLVRRPAERGPISIAQDQQQILRESSRIQDTIRADRRKVN